MWGMVRNERVRTEGSHEAFQTGEVSTPCREHQTCMKELTIKLLGFVQIVGWPGQPFFVI